MEGSTAISDAGRDALGYIGGGILAMSLAPQIIQLLMTKSAADISLMWSLLYLLGTSLSFIYLLMLGALAAWIPVAVELLGCFITISLKLLYDYTAWGKAQQELRQQEQFKQWQEQYLEALKLGQHDGLNPVAGSTAPAGLDDAHSLDGVHVSVIANKAVQQKSEAVGANGIQVTPAKSLLYGLQPLESNAGDSAYGSLAEGPLSPAAAAAAMSFASFTLMQNSKARPWYSQTGIRHVAAVPQNPAYCCHVCGAPQLLRSRNNSHAGGANNLMGSLPGAGLINNMLQSFTAGVSNMRGSLVGSRLGGGVRASTPGKHQQGMLSVSGQSEPKVQDSAEKLVHLSRLGSMGPGQSGRNAADVRGPQKHPDDHADFVAKELKPPNKGYTHGYTADPESRLISQTGYVGGPVPSSPGRRHTIDNLHANPSTNSSHSGAGSRRVTLADRGNGTGSAQQSHDGRQISSSPSSRFLVWSNQLFSYSGRSRDGAVASNRRSTGDHLVNPLYRSAMPLTGGSAASAEHVMSEHAAADRAPQKARAAAGLADVSESTAAEAAAADEGSQPPNEQQQGQ